MDRSITRSGGRTILALAGLPALLLLACGAWTSIRLSRADFLFRENTSASVQQAATLDPTNGRYQAWLAELLENEGADSTAALERAARLNPMDSGVWIRRGLNAELAGDRAGAERLLIHAAAIDRLMEPRWTLMNFYFRQGDQQNFWRWTKQTFDMSYGDRTPLFELCWRMRQDAAQIAALSSDAPLLRQFLQFLLAKGQTAAAADVALRVAPQAATSDLPVLADCLDRVLAAEDAGRAVRLWNALCERRLLPFERLDPAAGASLVNGGFTHFPSGVAFDWRIVGGEGVSAVSTASPDSLRLSLSGKQADPTPLLAQIVPLEPARRYRLRFLYQTAGFEGESGIRLSAAGASTPDLLSAGWREQALEFTSGVRRLERIVFEYRRPHGFVRQEGWIALRGVRLDFAQ